MTSYKFTESPIKHREKKNKISSDGGKNEKILMAETGIVSVKKLWAERPRKFS